MQTIDKKMLEIQLKFRSSGLVFQLSYFSMNANDVLFDYKTLQKPVCLAKL